MEFIKLKSNIDVKRIYQISDIHIHRSNERYEEYIEVIEEFVKQIESNNLVVCCGDVFHDGLNADALQMAKWMTKRISEKCDMIIIRGNHDQTSRSNNEMIDNMTAGITDLKTTKDVYVLNKTGIYEYGNIIFGHTDVYDNKILEIPGKMDKIKIGLWHGSLIGSINDIGYKLGKKIKREDFACYDYVLLGDIHKMQYITHNIAYSGSMIQQNYGETLGNHGYIKWDLVEKKSEFVELKNNYGFVTIRTDDNIPQVPKIIRLRIKCRQDEEIKINKIKDDIVRMGVNILECVIDQEREEIKTVEVDNHDTDDIERLMEYIKELGKYDEQELVEMRNIILEEKEKIKEDKKNRNIQIKKLEFDNFNVFGENNVIDYEKLRGIINITGRNGIGKTSAIVNALIFAIYGKYESKITSNYDYVNNKTKYMRTLINAEVNGKLYRIERVIDSVRSGRANNKVHLYENNKDIGIKGKIEEKIIEIFGESDELVRSSVMEQRKNISFLDMSDCEKRDKICEMLKLDIYNKIENNLEKENKENNVIIKENEKRATQLNEGNKEERKKQIMIYIDTRQKEMDEIVKKLKEKQRIIIGTEILLKKYEKLSKNRNVIVVSNELKQIEMQFKQNKEKYEEQEKRFREYKEKYDIIKLEKNNELYEANKKNKMKKLIEQLEELNRKYTNIENKINSGIECANKVKLQTKIQKIENKLSRILVRTKELEKIINNFRENNKNTKEEYKYLVRKYNDLKNRENELEENYKIKNDIENKILEIMNRTKEYTNIENCNDIRKKITQTKRKITLAKKKNISTDKLEKDLHKMYKNQQIDSQNEETISNIIKCMENITEVNEGRIIALEKKINEYDVYLLEKEKYDMALSELEILNGEKQENERRKNKISIKLELLENKIEEGKKQDKIELANKEILDKISNIKIELDVINKEVNKEYCEYKKQQTYMDSAMEQMIEMRTFIENNKIRMIELKKEHEICEEYEKNKDEYESKKMEYEKHRVECNELEVMKNKIEKELMSLFEEKTIIQQEETEIENIGKENMKLKKKYILKQKIVDIIKNGFIDQLLEKKILPRIEKEVNTVLRMYVNYEIRIKTGSSTVRKMISISKIKEGKESNAQMLSGYEILMCNIVFRMVINKINRIYKTDFMIIDEGFAYCDGKGVEKLSKLFDYMREQYAKVLLITHNEQIKSYTDQEIMIQEKNGYSQIHITE